jgi:hypothetical protein
MTVAEIKRPPRNQDAIQLLEGVLTTVRENPDATEVLVFVKIDGDYHRMSSGLTDMMHLVATLELAKHDTLCRMKE